MFHFKGLLQKSSRARFALLITALYLAQESVDAGVITTVTPVAGSFDNPSSRTTPSTTAGGFTVQAYFDAVYGPGFVTLSSSGPSGPGRLLWGNGYNGEGHVVGPTLAAGGTKNFLITDQSIGDHAMITMRFASPIYG